MSCFDDFYAVAKDALETAGKKTEEAVEFSKLKLSVAGINSDLAKAYQRLGTVVYDMTKNDLHESALVDRCISEIDVLKSQKQQAEAELNARRKNVTCPNCGASCSKAAAFCSNCGTALVKE